MRKFLATIAALLSLTWFVGACTDDGGSETADTDTEQADTDTGTTDDTEETTDETTDDTDETTDDTDETTEDTDETTEDTATSDTTDSSPTTGGTTTGGGTPITEAELAQALQTVGLMPNFANCVAAEIYPNLTEQEKIALKEDSGDPATQQTLNQKAQDAGRACAERGITPDS